jgi:aarF domain-containing kinase
LAQTKEYDEEFRQEYKRILRASFSRNKQEVIDRSIKFNLISDKESESVLDYYYEMIDFMVSPFRFDGEFEFNDQAYYQRSKDYAFNFSKKARYSPPPEKILFLHRKLGGVFQLLKKMDMNINVFRYWNKYIGHS